MQIKNFIKENLDRIIAVIAVIILYVVYAFSGIRCPIRYTTGVSCMGCGMTRALWSAFTLNFKDAFYYHPLWVLVPPAVVVFLFRKKINEKVWKVLLGIGIAAFIIVYFIRLFDTHNHVVVFEPEKSIIGKLIY